MKISVANGMVLYSRYDTLDEAIAEAVYRLQVLNQTGVLLNDEYKIVARFGYVNGVIACTQIVTENRRIYETGQSHRAYGWGSKVNGSWTDDQCKHYREGFEGRPYSGD